MKLTFKLKINLLEFLLYYILYHQINIMENTITVYSKESCSYCKKTKAFLTNLDIKFNEILLNPDDTNDKNIILNLKDKYNHHTFPFIIVNENLENEVFIGGFSELEYAYNTMYLYTLVSIENHNVDF